MSASNGKKLSARTQRGASVHEAGHAVLAELFGVRVKLIRIARRSDDFSPGIAPDKRGPVQGRVVYDQRCTASTLLRALVAAGGSAAEQLLLGEDEAEFSADDYDYFSDTVGRHRRIGRDAAIILHCARGILAEHRASLEWLAGELFLKGQLTGTEVRSAIKKANSARRGESDLRRPKL